MKLKNGFLILFFALVSQLAIAQTGSFSLQGVVELQQNSINTASMDTLNYVSCRFTLTDTVSIVKIHIQLGSSLHGNDLVDTSFVFDATQGLPADMSYERIGNVVTIGLGYFYPMVYYADAKLEDVYGGMSMVRTARF